MKQSQRDDKVVSRSLCGTEPNAFFSLSNKTAHMDLLSREETRDYVEESKAISVPKTFAD